MHPALSRNLFVVKEHTGIFKAANNYDILDPESGETVLHCREPSLGALTKVLRFTDFKRMTPFDVHITTPTGQPVIRVHRGVSILLSKVSVHDDEDRVICGFQQKLFSIGGAFSVHDQNDRPVCQLKGKWTGWNFRFLDGERLLAEVSKKWSGLGKELFTSADTYVLSIADSVAAADPVRALIMGSVMCIDMVLKE